ncbi:hypothetical protein AB0K52_12420 [Glycomyces sp. NPDC049804]|uniref:hypothetical protein n=1 Tax=Glycomyces sp. NPDC049804 TaxID=3154363 RepID=UPI0034408E00
MPERGGKQWGAQFRGSCQTIVDTLSNPNTTVSLNAARSISANTARISGGTSPVSGFGAAG